jgi:K+-sensing histidine kinase KdpD
MTTVNNILKHNAWASGLRRCQPDPYDLYDLEGDVLPDILSLVPQKRLVGLSIEFRHDFASGRHVFTTDAHLLKDCLQAIILNAIYSVSGVTSGVVSLTARSTPDLSKLMFDVVDNGCGIDATNQAQIFEPYEQVDSHKPRAGLGLTLASKIARTMNGCVKLVSSALGSGSHFQVEFQDPILGPLVDRPTSPPLPLEYLTTKTFHYIRHGDPFNHFTDHVATYLERKASSAVMLRVPLSS